MTPKEAKRELLSIRRLESLANAVLGDITKTRADMQRIGSMRISDMPRGGVFVTLDDVLARYEELLNKQACIINQYAEAKARCVERVERIDSAELRQVLYERYFNYYEWERVADIMNYDVRQVYRMHGRALREFAQVSEE